MDPLDDIGGVLIPSEHVLVVPANSGTNTPQPRKISKPAVIPAPQLASSVNYEALTITTIQGDYGNEKPVGPRWTRTTDQSYAS